MSVVLKLFGDSAKFSAGGMEGRDFVVAITIAPNVRLGGFGGVTGDRDSGDFSSAWRRARGVAKWKSCEKFVDGGETERG